MNNEYGSLSVFPKYVILCNSHFNIISLLKEEYLRNIYQLIFSEVNGIPEGVFPDSVFTKRDKIFVYNNENIFIEKFNSLQELPLTKMKMSKLFISKYDMLFNFRLNISEIKGIFDQITITGESLPEECENDKQFVSSFDEWKKGQHITLERKLKEITEIERLFELSKLHKVVQ
jgi:hypothetical protein